MNSSRTLATVAARRRSRAVLASVLALAGCGGDATGNEDAVNDDGSVDLSKVTLIVGDQKGGCAKALLQAAGQLDDADYEIEWKEFTSGPPLLEALNAGAIHVGGVGNTPPIFAAAAQERVQGRPGRDVRRRGRRDRGAEGLPDQGRRRPEGQDRRGRRGQLGQLQPAGPAGRGRPEVLATSTSRTSSPADALAAFSAGHLDAWAIWEPVHLAGRGRRGRRAGDRRRQTSWPTATSSRSPPTPRSTTRRPRRRSRTTSARIAQAQVWSQTPPGGLGEGVGRARPASSDDDHRWPRSRSGQVEVVPIDQTVIDSEQEMADAFADNDLLPGEVDVAPLLHRRVQRRHTHRGGERE